MALPSVIAPLVSVVETLHEVVEAENLSQIIRSFIPAEPVAVHVSLAFAGVVTASVGTVGVAAHICHNARRLTGRERAGWRKWRRAIFLLTRHKQRYFKIRAAHFFNAHIMYRNSRQRSRELFSMSSEG